MNRRHVLLMLAATPLLASAASARAAAGGAATLYKDPDCGCCTEYGHYLESQGYEVKVVADAAAMEAVKAKHRVPLTLSGCHSTVIDGYIVEGHVPVGVVAKMLSEKPAIRGVSLPGMPMGSPGMSGTKEEPFEIYAITDDKDPPLYAVE